MTEYTIRSQAGGSWWLVWTPGQEDANTFHTHTEALRWIDTMIQIANSEALDAEQDRDNA